jgi:hypothetical protein
LFLCHWERPDHQSPWAEYQVAGGKKEAVGDKVRFPAGHRWEEQLIPPVRSSLPQPLDRLKATGIEAEIVVRNVVTGKINVSNAIYFQEYLALL